MFKIFQSPPAGDVGGERLMKPSIFSKNSTTLSLLALLGGLNAAAAMQIPLAFSPAKGADVVSIDDLPGWRAHSVLIDNVVDGRGRKKMPDGGDVIGISRQENNEPYITADDVPFWCTQSIKYTLHEIGVAVVEENPSIIIRPTLRKLFVDEGSTYRGVAHFTFTILNAAGEVLGEEEIRDSSGFWGDTQSEKEFLEALGNAMVNIVGALVKNERITAWVDQQPRPSLQSPPLTLHDPADLGIRGEFRSKPSGMTGGSIALLSAATVVLCVSQFAFNGRIREVGLISVPLFCAGFTLGTIAIVKFKLWSDWYTNKPGETISSSGVGGAVTWSF
jgi:hypothetical protein